MRRGWQNDKRGDLTYRQHLLMDDVVDGMTETLAVSLASHRAMKQFAQNESVVLLPAHDPEAARRLSDGLIMYPRSSPNQHRHVSSVNYVAQADCLKKDSASQGASRYILR